MPLAQIHLLALENARTLLPLLKHIRTAKTQPLIVSTPVRWIILPQQINAEELLSPKWDLLLIVVDDSGSKDLLTSILGNTNSWRVISHFQINAGIPSRLTKDFQARNAAENLHPKSAPVKLTGALDKPLTRGSSQTLALGPELTSFIRSNAQRPFAAGAVSMLNFLAFNPGKKESYLQYGKAFAESIGKNRGGNAKLVGNVVNEKSEDGEVKWDEFALAHYPSLTHFADMLASEDYQEVNQRYRVPALRDTCILFTSELEVERLLEGEAGEELSAKL